MGLCVLMGRIPQVVAWHKDLLAQLNALAVKERKHTIVTLSMGTP